MRGIGMSVRGMGMSVRGMPGNMVRQFWNALFPSSSNQLSDHLCSNDVLFLQYRDDCTLIFRLMYWPKRKVRLEVGCQGSLRKGSVKSSKLISGIRRGQGKEGRGISC